MIAAGLTDDLSMSGKRDHGLPEYLVEPQFTHFNHLVKEKLI
jgi:hypothetical protein